MQDNEPAVPTLPWWRRLEQTKLTPLVFLAFFGFLAVMSAAAAGIGFLTHHMTKAPAHQTRP